VTLHLILSADMEERLRHEADRLGEPDEAVALRLLDRSLPPSPSARQKAALDLLGQWQQEDAALAENDLAENAQVLRTLDEDRPSHRKLFPELSRTDSK
jgi:hypothetical protein